MIQRDPRRAKQYGDFGESLVMHLLVSYRGMKVAVVDHAGADLIASDPHMVGKPERRLAISVKSRNLNLSPTGGLESRLYHFDQRNVDHLRGFADSFGLAPAVALVMTLPPAADLRRLEKSRKRAKELGAYFLGPRETSVSAIFIVKLDEMLDLASSPHPPRFVGANRKGGFNFKFEESYFAEIVAHPAVDFSEFVLSRVPDGPLWSESLQAPGHANPPSFAEKQPTITE